MWRTGYGLAAAGWLGGAAILGWLSWRMITFSLPDLERYLPRKYSAVEMWRYERQVPWQLIPGVY